MYYQFWNDFIDFWRSQPNFKATSPNPFYSGHADWSHPNAPQVLYNSNKIPNDLSFEYLPEPWWGNSGTEPLNSVVINYNPGQGNNYQKYTTLNLL